MVIAIIGILVALLLPAADVVVSGFVCPSWTYPAVFGEAASGYEYQNGAIVTYAGCGGGGDPPPPEGERDHRRPE